MKRVIKATAEDNSVKLRVEYEVYTRNGSGGIKRATVSGPTLFDALKKLVDKMGLYITSEDIEKQKMTSEAIIENIDMSNGDGCDYIIQLKNLTTGEVLIQGEDFSEEEW